MGPVPTWTVSIQPIYFSLEDRTYCINHPNPRTPNLGETTVSITPGDKARVSESLECTKKGKLHHLGPHECPFQTPIVEGFTKTRGLVCQSGASPNAGPGLSAEINIYLVSITVTLKHCDRKSFQLPVTYHVLSSLSDHPARDRNGVHPQGPVRDPRRPQHL
jgi:hypothetical protein